MHQEKTKLSCFSLFNCTITVKEGICEKEGPYPDESFNFGMHRIDPMACVFRVTEICRSNI